MADEKLLALCRAAYDDDGLAQAVADDAKKQGTTEKILSGELVLPHKNDASHFHLRQQGIPVGEHGDAAKAKALVQALIARIAALETRGVPKPQKEGF